MKLIKLIDKKAALVVLLVYVVGFGYPYASHFFKYNISDSVPQKFWFVDYGNKSAIKNNYIVAKFHDPRTEPSSFEFVIKQIGGVAGDVITVETMIKPSKMVSNRVGRHVMTYWINGESFPVYDMLSGYEFHPLTVTNLTIPKACFFVHGTHQPSFDSRYKEFGFICESQIEGIAQPFF
jgi:type IV secretory pathway protease TraF